NSDTHTNSVFMPKLQKDEPQYMGFFHTGAYQESLAGYGGIQHCLIPAPKHLVIDKDENGKINITVFAQQQSANQMLDVLGY
ncbi:MAG: arginine decarboxylase, partial [Bacteroidia bacterium]|nr:arginine decarboxylase [Bacteroidia bacterium]